MAVARVSRWRWLLRWAIRVTGLFVGSSVVLIIALRWVDPPTSAFMLQRRWAMRDAPKPFVVRFKWVPLTAISPELQRAVIAAEDQKFTTHHGFDFDAIRAALEDRIEKHKTRGASTITQQVAKNLFLWPARSFIRKGLEAYLTLLIEMFWPKQRILEMHLNLAEYGDGVYGAEAAARAYFRKSASTLTAIEAARMATVLPAPRRRNVAALSETMLLRAEQIAESARTLEPDPVTVMRAQ